MRRLLIALIPWLAGCHPGVRDASRQPVAPHALIALTDEELFRAGVLPQKVIWTRHDAIWTAAPESGEGACDPLEYTAYGRLPVDVVFRVSVDDAGRAERLEVISSAPPRDEALATDAVRHLFRCRRQLAPDAPRVIEGYLFHFAPIRVPDVDGAACARNVAYPPSAQRYGVEARVKVGVGLDGAGRVVSAWVDDASAYGFADAAIDALAHHCIFGPANQGHDSTPFFLVYTVEFAMPSS